MVLDDPLEPGGETNSKKLPSSRFKGVVPQPNGRWGSQIYEKHHRVWLGTSTLEVEAARVYDIAAQCFRGRDAVTNFKALSHDNGEEATVLAFLNSHSKPEIVDMLRKHTYDDELHQSRVRSLPGSGENPCKLSRNGNKSMSSREHLFDKVITPSDVGKLNRLVIPKQHAEKYFPLSVEKSKMCKSVHLNLEDIGCKVWRFRYSYWNSSQSYVFTKGWSRFVKENGCKSGDIVRFFRSTRSDRNLYIDWKPRLPISSIEVGEEGEGEGEGEGTSCGRSDLIGSVRQPSQVVRLFGVDIVDQTPNKVLSTGGDWSGKKRTELDLFPYRYYKKQNIGC